MHLKAFTNSLISLACVALLVVILSALYIYQSDAVNYNIFEALFTIAVISYICSHGVILELFYVGITNLTYIWSILLILSFLPLCIYAIYVIKPSKTLLTGAVIFSLIVYVAPVASLLSGVTEYCGE